MLIKGHRYIVKRVSYMSIFHIGDSVVALESGTKVIATLDKKYKEVGDKVTAQYIDMITSDDVEEA